MAKVVKGALKVIGAVAGVLAVIPSPIQPIAAAVSVGASIASTALNILAPSKPRASVIGRQTDFSLDPQAGIPYAIGRTFYGGNVVKRDSWGTDNEYQGFTIVYSGGGRIDGIESFLSDQVQTTFDSSGNANGFYHDFMWFRSQLGDTPSPALTSPVAGFPGINSAFKLSGYCAANWVLAYDLAEGEKYPGGVPRSGVVLRGNMVYDPRLDSNYPGGSGPCRPLEESTYVYSENPWLHALTWTLGRWQNGIKVIGVGASIDSINLNSFVNAANVAQANDWKVGGVVSSLDDKYEVLEMMAQAGGGQTIRIGANISAFVESPKVSIATVTMEDVIGPMTIAPIQFQRNQKNGVVPVIRSEAHGWEEIPLDPVRFEQFVAEDGERLTDNTSLRLVQQTDQAAELASYEVLNSREYGPVELPLKLRWLGIEPGDAINLDLPDESINDQQFIVLSRGVDPTTGQVSLALRSETFEKHALALGMTTTVPPTPSLDLPDLSNVPVPGADAWTLVSDNIIGGSGGETPILSISGQSDLPTASQIAFEYRPITSPESDWIFQSTLPATIRKLEIAAITPETQYEVAVSYIRLGIRGPRRVIGPITTGQSVATSVAPGSIDYENDITNLPAVIDPANITDSGRLPSASVEYSDGRTVASLQPAAAGADATSDNIAAGYTGQNYASTAPDDEVLNQYNENTRNFIVVGSGVLVGSTVYKTGGFGFNGGVYSLEAAQSFFVSCYYDFNNMTGRSLIGLSSEQNPDGTSSGGYEAYAQILGSPTQQIQFWVGGVRVANLNYSEGTIPISGQCSIFYDGASYNIYVNGQLKFSKVAPNENIIVRALVLPLFGGIGSSLFNVNYGPANNSTWASVYPSSDKPADSASATVTLETYGPLASGILISANAFSTSVNSNQSGVMTKVCRSNSCMYQFTLNGTNGGNAGLFDINDYTAPADRFDVGRLHLFIGSLNADGQYPIQMRYRNEDLDPVNAIFGGNFNASQGDIIGLGYDGVNYFVTNGGDIAATFAAQSGFIMKGYTAIEGVLGAVNFPFIDINWTDFNDNAQPFHDGPTSLTITANHLGQPDAGQLDAAAFIMRRRRGATDVSSSSIWSIVDEVNCSASVMGGGVTINSVTGNGGFTVRSVRENLKIDTIISIALSKSIAPATGSSSGGTTVNDSTFAPTNSTAFADISGELTVETGVDGEIQFSAPLNFSTPAAAPAGEWGAEIKWQYKIAGSSNWTDVAAAVNEINTAQTFEENGLDFGGGTNENFYYSNQGSIQSNPVLSGTANASYDVRLLARRRSGSNKLINWFGTISAVGS